MYIGFISVHSMYSNYIYALLILVCLRKKISILQLFIIFFYSKKAFSVKTGTNQVVNVHLILILCMICLWCFGLGIAQPSWWDLVISSGTTDKVKESSPTPTSVHSPTPPTQRRLAKSFSVAPSSVTKG